VVVGAIVIVEKGEAHDLPEPTTFEGSRPSALIDEPLS
jgi:hypothetical protein